MSTGLSTRHWLAGALLSVGLVAGLLAGCGKDSKKNAAHEQGDDTVHAMAQSASPGPQGTGGATRPGNPLPGMPPLLDPNNVYAADGLNMVADAIKGDKQMVYVPNNGANTVTVIDPTTYKVVKTVKVGTAPQHVVPSWDLRTLWVNNNEGNSLTPINPATGEFGKAVQVDDPYNLYFTPDGKYAMVMEEGLHKITFRDPKTMVTAKEVKVDCEGINHVDFSPDGRYFIATCEFSGDLLKIDVERMQVLGKLHLPGKNPMPQDIKISPDGKTWYVADMQTSGIWILDGDAFTTPTFLATGDGAHGLYPSRDAKYLYIANRGEGSVSLLDFATKQLVKKWKIPGQASPDMGGVSADGKVLWLSGRYHDEVYAMDTTDGHLLARIKVGKNPHGLCVWPQPGRYSLGHTGILR